MRRHGPSRRRAWRRRPMAVTRRSPPRAQGLPSPPASRASPIRCWRRWSSCVAAVAGITAAKRPWRAPMGTRRRPIRFSPTARPVRERGRGGPSAGCGRPTGGDRGRGRGPRRGGAHPQSRPRRGVLRRRGLRHDRLGPRPRARIRICEPPRRADRPPPRLASGSAALLAGGAAALALLTRALGVAAGAGVVAWLYAARRVNVAPARPDLGRQAALASLPLVVAGAGWGAWLFTQGHALDPLLATDYGSYFELLRAAGAGALGSRTADLARPLGVLTLNWVPSRLVYYGVGLPALVVGVYGLACIARPRAPGGRLRNRPGGSA